MKEMMSSQRTFCDSCGWCKPIFLLSVLLITLSILSAHDFAFPKIIINDIACAPTNCTHSTSSTASMSIVNSNTTAITINKNNNNNTKPANLSFHHNHHTNDNSNNNNNNNNNNSNDNNTNHIDINNNTILIAQYGKDGIGHQTFSIIGCLLFVYGKQHELTINNIKYVSNIRHAKEYQLEAQFAHHIDQEKGKKFISIFENNASNLNNNINININITKNFSNIYFDYYNIKKYLHDDDDDNSSKSLKQFEFEDYTDKKYRQNITFDFLHKYCTNYKVCLVDHCRANENLDKTLLIESRNDLQKYFQLKYISSNISNPNIFDDRKNFINIVIHIRLGDARNNKNRQETLPSIFYYTNIIQCLKIIFSNSTLLNNKFYHFFIHSDGLNKTEIDLLLSTFDNNWNFDKNEKKSTSFYKSNMIHGQNTTIYNGEKNDIFFAIDQMVHADIFIQGSSSISNMVSMLNNNVIICHRYCFDQYNYINVITILQSINDNNYTNLTNYIKNQLIPIWHKLGYY